MYLYFVTRPVALRTNRQSMTLRVVDNPQYPPSDAVYIAAQKEIDLLRHTVASDYPGYAAEEILHILTTESARSISGMPPLLGAREKRLHGRDEQPEDLVFQLEAIAAAHPSKNRFRFLLINAFGTNLGDNLIGLSAFASVLRVMRSVLGEVSVDVMLGWHDDDRLERLYRGVDGIGEILTCGIPVAQMGRYQGIFDMTLLLQLPEYGTMPMVDWYLRWMGVDPASIQPENKRNRVMLNGEAVKTIAPLLPDGMRIAFNPKASIPLRTMPEAASERLIALLLERYPDAQIVLTCPIRISHPRVHDFSAHLSDVDRLAALVANCDALIGVDTYTQHLADAFDVPAVTLYTSVLPSLYPYYPYCEAILLPGAQRLPAWGKMKLSRGGWRFVSHFYEAAWDALDHEEIDEALCRARERTEWIAR